MANIYNVTITFNVNGQIISCNEKDMTLLSDSIDLIKARFNFSPEWQGYTKTAIFKNSTKKAYSKILVDDACMVPSEVIKKSKYMSVSVFGVSGTQLITTTDQIVPLTPSGYTDDSIVSPAPTENIYQQIVTLMQKQAVDAVHAETAQSKAEKARDDAEGHAEQTALDSAATSADRMAVNEALTGFTETTLPNAIQAVENKADIEIARVGQAGAEQIGLATAQADRAEDSASAADASAKNAAQSATDAAVYAGAASDSASASKASEKNASDSATKSANSASASATSEKNAASSAESAKQSAETAAVYVSAAEYSLGINPNTGHMAVFYNGED